MNAASASVATEKPRIGERFDEVAESYDLLCKLNPGYRRHLRWSARRLEAPRGARLLDLCCGTGLSTEALAEVYPDAHVVGLDVSAGMLERARERESTRTVHFHQGDAMDPRAAGIEGDFDGILMAYGLRNVPDPDLCLERLRALLKPGGTLCVHEYSVADSWLRRATWTAVSWSIVIPLAFVVQRSTRIFRYLWRSVLEFDGVEALRRRLQDAGFVDVEVLPLDGWQRGITHTFRARRPRS